MGADHREVPPGDSISWEPQGIVLSKDNQLGRGEVDTSHAYGK